MPKDMTVADQIAARLTSAFAPERLEVENESHRHAGHAGDDGSGDSHFRIVIRAQALAPLGRVARHRAVYAALGDLTTRVHALALDIG
jgi:BolA family transcriptional regulator, general stress-responsive regulator